jgi:uncharacterized repeat protein (TIGR03803 family)
MKRSLKSAIALLMMASTSVVGAQTLQTLYSFDNVNGAYPYAPLTLGNDGNFYGTTSGGGIWGAPYGDGTVFKVTTNRTLTTLVSFSGNNGGYPTAALMLGNDGNFYGTAYGGGSRGGGTVFKMTTNGTLTTLVSFSITNGSGPYAALTLGNDGTFYGTTFYGGITNSTNPDGMGTVFKVTTNGTLTKLVSFAGANGANPIAGLTLGNDGTFYGTTYMGGITNDTYTDGVGTVFKVTTNGTMTTLVAFNGNNGAYPRAALTLGNDGTFYGTAGGTVFKVTTNGTLTTLAVCSTCYGGLTLGNDGNFYGTTWYGGSSDVGTVFKVTTNGVLTSLVSFNNTNGAHPHAGLTLGSDGNFYGTTYGGGSSGYGTVFCLLLPLITIQPQSQTNNAGATVTFLVSATDPNPMGYQWQKNGTNLVNGGNISGATTDTLTITGISDSDAASYSVVVSNSNRSVTSSNAVLTVNDSLFIALQPQSQTVGLGSNITFTVTVYGAPPFVFQWYFNGKPLGSPTTGTNFSLCALANVGTNQAGNYSVEVFNGYGSLMSSNAVLTVKVFPPSIALQPASQRVVIGRSASFSVSVSGTAPFRYQWRFNGGGIFNATNAAYAIQAVGATNTGNYSVVVTNLAGSVTSSNAFLAVIIPPTLALQLWAGYPLLNLNGMLGNNFVVQYSTNLAGTNWIDLLSLSNLPASPYPFLDPAGDGEPARFYRAFMR